MPDKVRNREWLEADEMESGAPGLPRPDLNPLMNPLLGKNMGRWAQVYFTSPPDQREHAVEKLLHELQAESGTGMAAGSTQKKDNEVLHNPLKREPEFESPAPPVRDSVNDAPDLDAEVLQDVIACPGCRHKNPAEQRFCGICGMTLTRGVATAAPDAAPREQASRPDENPESDWRWLRERTLSTYDVQSDTGRRSRVLIVALVFVVIALGAYILWQNRARLSHEQAAPAASSVSEPVSSPSMNVPVMSTPSPGPAQQSARARSHLSSTKSAQAAEPRTGNPAGPELSSASTSDDGRDELIRARQYLSGEGVRKNSWMASQLLWKAIGKQNSEAVLLLSDLYARGDGVPRSCEQARILLVSAAKKGSSAAAQKLRSIEASCR
jgi:hypothetical protein